MIHLLAQAFVQFAAFNERARRAEFWLFILSLLVITNVTSVLMEGVQHHKNGLRKFTYIEKGMREGGFFRFEDNGKWRRGDKWSCYHHFVHRDDTDDYMPNGLKSVPDVSGRWRHHDHYHQEMSCTEFITGGKMIAGTPGAPEDPIAP